MTSFEFSSAQSLPQRAFLSCAATAGLVSIFYLLLLIHAKIAKVDGSPKSAVKARGSKGKARMGSPWKKAKMIVVFVIAAANVDA